MSAINDNPTRKLKTIVITMGAERQKHIKALFAHPTMQEHFEPPTFSPGIPQRQLRTRYDLLTHAGKAGILPEAEWKALSSPEAKLLNDEDPVTLFDILDDVPVEPGRRGSDFDVKMHYARELWQKGKGINRGRSVLACAFAHLVAMRKLVDEGYDIILEDNVRAPISSISTSNNKTHSHTSASNLEGQEKSSHCECAHRIRETIAASKELEEASGKKCHMRYYGWLGSRPNLEFVMDTHCERTKYKRENGFRNYNDNPDTDTDINTDHGSAPSVFPFPITSDIEQFLGEATGTTSRTEEDEKADDEKSSKTTKPGGTPIWGAFAYWVSKEAHSNLIESLQKDVGAFLWKAKKWRCHKVKPIDKIIPRRIINSFSLQIETETETETETNGDGDQDGRDHVHVATHPAFFRAPMLTSQIHSQWDAEFCKSTEFQMKRCRTWTERNNDDENMNMGIEWDHLWLTDEENQIVEHRKLHNEWITLKQLEEQLKAIK